MNESNLQLLSTGQSLTMGHYWHLCDLFLLVIDNMPVFECLYSYNKNYGQWASLLNVYIFQNKWQFFFFYIFLLPCCTKKTPKTPKPRSVPNCEFCVVGCNNQFCCLVFVIEVQCLGWKRNCFYMQMIAGWTHSCTHPVYLYARHNTKTNAYSYENHSIYRRTCICLSVYECVSGFLTWLRVCSSLCVCVCVCEWNVSMRNGFSEKEQTCHCSPLTTIY